MITTEQKLENFHRRLNAPEIVPAVAYRRNSIHYQLICYVNNIVALYLSWNFDGIPIFIRRALKAVERVSEEGGRDERYYRIVESYLQTMARYVQEKGIVRRTPRFPDPSGIDDSGR